MQRAEQGKPRGASRQTVAAGRGGGGIRIGPIASRTKVKDRAGLALPCLGYQRTSRMPLQALRLRSAKSRSIGRPSPAGTLCARNNSEGAPFGELTRHKAKEQKNRRFRLPANPSMNVPCPLSVRVKRTSRGDRGVGRFRAGCRSAAIMPQDSLVRSFMAVIPFRKPECCGRWPAAAHASQTASSRALPGHSGSAARVRPEPARPGEVNAEGHPCEALIGRVAATMKKPVSAKFSRWFPMLRMDGKDSTYAVLEVWPAASLCQC